LSSRSIFLLEHDLFEKPVPSFPDHAASDVKEAIMANDKPPPALQIKTFADHKVITQPNPLRKVLRRVPESDLDDPIGRAEKALEGLSSEFRNWMAIEADRLSTAHAAILKQGFTNSTREELFRAAHDIKGDAATFGYPSAAAAAESLCRIIEHAPDLNAVPSKLIAHHINAIQAIVHKNTKLDTVIVANELSRQLRGIADEYLTHANRDRPEHLEAILAPSIVPGD
jgi:HPt (histidine-containing phosphotransfer) domain-containing protein